MTTQKTNRVDTVKTINRFEAELNDYFSDFDNLSSAFADNYLASEMQTICREALQRIEEVKKEYEIK